MQQSDHGIKHSKLCDVCRIDCDDAADQDFLDVLGAERRTIDDQYRRGGRDDVEDSDDGLLAHRTGDAARDGQKRSTDRREHEGIGKAGRTLDVVSIGERHTGAERRQLCKRKVCEDDFPAQHVNAQISMDQDEDHRGDERKRQERDRLRHAGHGFCDLNASARRATL